MKRFAIPRLAVTLGALLTMSVALRTDAALLKFDLDSYGLGNAGGNVVVTVEDASGDVKISMTNNTEGFITDLFLNYGTVGGLAGATVKDFDGGSDDVTPPTVRFNGLQGFAIDLAFQTGNNTPGRFGPHESVTFFLDATNGLTAAQFDQTGKGPFGDDFHAAVHVNGNARGNCTEGTSRLGDANGANISGNSGVTPCEIPSTGGGPVDVSSVSVPEPHTFALMGLGILGVMLSRRGRRA